MDQRSPFFLQLNYALQQQEAILLERRRFASHVCPSCPYEHNLGGKPV